MPQTTSALVERFIYALDQLDKAPSFAKSKYQTDVYQEANRLIEAEDGFDNLYQHAGRLEEAGVFQDGPWEAAEKLQPPLVAGSLKAKGLPMIIEVLSEMRMLALAKGKATNPNVPPEMAEEFLNEVMVLNLNLLFPDASESSRIEKHENDEKAGKLFQFLSTHLSSTALIQTLINEIKRLTAQRPIMVKRILSMIRMAKEMLDHDSDEHGKAELKQFIAAIEGPSKLSAQFNDVHAYRSQLKTLTRTDLISESVALAQSMRETGLVAPHHATLIRFLSKRNPALLVYALNLNSKGSANLEEHRELVIQLIRASIFPGTRQAIYGLSMLLERGVLSHSPVAPGLRRLVELDIRPDVRNALYSTTNTGEGVTANSILVAGTIQVLGQPLGVGQGFNPTCQAARGISLWAQHAPGFLLEIIPRAARDGDLDFTFEGTPIHSKELTGGLAPDLDKELDPVSLVLVPHLDKIYSEMMTRVALRGEDGHRWVNPAFYGNWVQKGFSSVFDPITGYVLDYPGFVKLFYATHHTEYNDDYELIYPNPVGIFITNVHGKLLGLHAVSITRITKDPSGEERIYFYNPNNDGSQNWGQNIEPSVIGNGEMEGESSLPFHQFVSRLYAFHYNPYEQGDAYAVENSIVDGIRQLAQESWGKDYTWV
ncbi:hypothetical protein GLW00_11135 [Halobacillus litoralis]|uniref:Uncharacterized protein n=1 Tax=Halobacillus litoralis TaxID=45668 RepID=A0A845FAS7_9BACI|nr:MULTISPECIES: hypothetical protein [Halobacillus]MEC3885097.1 hypothetical protein [Halobacillus sp. HZG1]MYL71413.1 hypothetical protein [Halobacillus litoralis]